MLNCFNISDHYEADISFIREKDQLFVYKYYRTKHDCIAWLNQHLAQYYSCNGTAPVAQHEFTALQILSRPEFGIAPEPIDIGTNYIVMKYAGISLDYSFWKISKNKFKTQALSIIEKLNQINFSHNDILPGNVLISNGQIQLIDFTLSEFNGISIRKDIPDLSWGRFGQDGNLVNFMNFSSQIGYIKNLYKKSLIKIKHIRGDM